MFPESVFAERRAFVEKMTSAPPEFVMGNAVALSRVLGELQNSLALELQVIHGVRQLDVERPADVNEYAERFREYIESRTFSTERTNCHRIAAIYSSQIRSRAPGYSSSAQTDALTEEIERLAGADLEFTDEIEPFMERCLTLVEEIRDASLAQEHPKARRLQEAFRDEYRPEVDRLKTAIRDLNAAGMSLIDMLGIDPR